MRYTNFVIFFALAAAAGGGVASGDAATISSARRGAPAPAPTQTYRGLVTVTAAGSQLAPCPGDTRTRPHRLVDGTAGDLARVYQAVAIKPGAPVYMELRGAAVTGDVQAESPAALAVSAVRRANGGEGRGCHESWAFSDLRARGNEPFWSLSIDGPILTFRRPDAPTMHVGPIEMATLAETTVYRAFTRNHRVEVRFTDKRCIDSMSGEHFALQVEADVDGKVFKGCAAERPSEAVEAEEAVTQGAARD